MGLRGREEKTFVFDGTIPARRSVFARQATASGVGTAFRDTLVMDCPYLRFFLVTSTRIKLIMRWPKWFVPIAVWDTWIERVFLAGQYDVYDLVAPYNQQGYLLIPYAVFRIELASWSIVPATVQFEAHCSSN